MLKERKGGHGNTSKDWLWFIDSRCHRCLPQGRKMSSCSQYLNRLSELSHLWTPSQQFVVWSYVKEYLLFVWQHAPGKRLTYGRNMTFISHSISAQHLFPLLLQIQPIDAVLLAAVKSRSDVLHAVVSTSPLLYLTHPSSLQLRRPLTLTLPCPPNPEKRRRRGVQEEGQDNHIWPVSASPAWDQPAFNRRRWVKYR